MNKRRPLSIVKDSYSGSVVLRSKGPVKSVFRSSMSVRANVLVERGMRAYRRQARDFRSTKLFRKHGHSRNGLFTSPSKLKFAMLFCEEGEI